MRKVCIAGVGAIFIFALTNTLVAQPIFEGAGAIEEWGYASAYYGWTVAGKGINLGGIVGLSDETHFRVNFGFLSGSSSFTEKHHYSEPDTSYDEKITYKLSLSAFPIEFWYLVHLPVGKIGSVYPGVGLGLYFGSVNCREEYEHPDTVIEQPSHSLSGFGIPIAIGIEKAVFGKNIRIFAEFQKNLYLYSKETWIEERTYTIPDTVHRKSKYSYSSYLSGTGRIRIGIVFIFGPPPTAATPKALPGRRSRMPRK